MSNFPNHQGGPAVPLHRYLNSWPADDKDAGLVMTLSDSRLTAYTVPKDWRRRCQRMRKDGYEFRMSQVGATYFVFCVRANEVIFQLAVDTHDLATHELLTIMSSAWKHFNKKRGKPAVQAYSEADLLKAIRKKRKPL